MITQKPERKDFGLRASPGGGWSSKLLFNPSAPNAPVGIAKSIESVFASSGFALTPRLAGGEEIRDPYLESWVVHACLRTIAESIEQVDIKILSGPEKDAKALGHDHPVVKLFARPNPWTAWSQLASMGSIHRNLSGEDFWFLTDADGKPLTSTKQGVDPMAPIDLPTAIYSVNGSSVGDTRDTDGRIKEWYYGTTAGSRIVFPVGSVLHFYNYDPTDPCRGIGPAEVAMRQLSIAFQAERYGEATLRSGGPGAFVVYEQDMAAEIQREFQEQIDSAMSDPRSVGKIKVLTGKPVVTPIPSNPKDMLSIDQLEWSRDVVASLFGVPLPIIGVLDNATYSNMKEAWRQFWLKRSAYLRTVEDVVNTSFFPRLKDPSLQRLRLAFDLANVQALKGDDKDLIELALKITAAGVGVTFNQALKHVGAQSESVDNGDKELYLASLQTAPNGPRQDAPPPAPAKEALSLILEELKHGNPDQEA